MKYCYCSFREIENSENKFAWSKHKITWKFYKTYISIYFMKTVLMATTDNLW